MKTALKLTAAALVLGVASASLASAQMGPGHHERSGEHTRGAMGLMMLQAADLDENNTVTLDEIETLEAQEFAFRDRNGDGFLTEADASPMMRRMHEIRAERREEADAGPHQGRHGRRGGRHERLAELDADQDRRISQAEFSLRHREMFDRLDANDDDAVTPDELDAALEGFQARRADRREAHAWWRG